MRRRSNATRRRPHQLRAALCLPNLETFPRKPPTRAAIRWQQTVGRAPGGAPFWAILYIRPSRTAELVRRGCTRLGGVNEEVSACTQLTHALSVYSVHFAPVSCIATQARTAHPGDTCKSDARTHVLSPERDPPARVCP